ncbi:MAG: hypothetical protein ACRDDX_08440 [Cellulosilyticaceae bacterium]
MSRFVPRCSKKTLFIIGGIVWMLAGSMVMKLGYEVVLRQREYQFLSVIVALVVFSIFYKFIFRKMAYKHQDRILNYVQEKLCVFSFFDKKGYIIMAAMMTLGITIRSIKFISPLCWAAFYVGLGTALFGGGVTFLLGWFRAKAVKIEG